MPVLCEEKGLALAVTESERLVGMRRVEANEFAEERKIDDESCVARLPLRDRAVLSSRQGEDM